MGKKSKRKGRVNTPKKKVVDATDDMTKENSAAVFEVMRQWAEQETKELEKKKEIEESEATPVEEEIENMESSAVGTEAESEVGASDKASLEETNKAAVTESEKRKEIEEKLAAAIAEQEVKKKEAKEESQVVLNREVGKESKETTIKEIAKIDQEDILGNGQEKRDAAGEQEMKEDKSEVDDARNQVSTERTTGKTFGTKSVENQQKTKEAVESAGKASSTTENGQKIKAKRIGTNKEENVVSATKMLEEDKKSALSGTATSANSEEKQGPKSTQESSSVVKDEKARAFSDTSEPEKAPRFRTEGFIALAAVGCIVGVLALRSIKK